MNAREYQAFLFPLIVNKFPTLEVINEWRAFTGFRNQYSPRVDIAIRPFSTTPGQTRENEYNHLVTQRDIKRFLTIAFEFHRINLDPLEYDEINHPPYDSLVTKNSNARCLIAIEIENTNSKKHMMGSIVNACSLGRIGIGLAYCDSALRTFLRIANYLAFLKRVGKTSYDTGNFLVLTIDQMERAIAMETESH